MMPQDGDHFAHPCDDPDVRDAIAALDSVLLRETVKRALNIAYGRTMIERGEATFAAPAERHLGIPTRHRDDEDRARFARFCAGAIRRREWARGAVELPTLLRFVPGIDRSPRFFDYIDD